VAVLAVVVAAAAVVLGVWATVAGKSGVFGRLTGLVGVCLLLLVVVLAAVAVLAWAQHPMGARLPVPDMVVVSMPVPVGSGQDTGSFPVLVMGDFPPSEPPADPMAELAAIWAGEPGGVAAGVLELMSVLSAAGIRRDLVCAAGPAGPLGGERAAEADAVAAALEQLAERSLLSSSLDGRVVSADRPVLRAVRDHLAEQERLADACRAAASVLEARCETLVGSRDRLAVLDVPDQVKALRDVVAGLPSAPDAELAGPLLRLRGWVLYHLNALGNRAQQAIIIGEPLIADQERVLGPDHPDTLAARNNLANAYQAAGRTDEAVTLHEQVLAGRKRVLGPDHPHTAQSQKNLAAARRAARVGEAIADKQARADPETIALQAQASAGLGAVALHARVLADRQEMLGPDHPDTLAARNNLALAYHTAGRTDEAIALHEQALTDRERVLGPDHPGTLNSRSNLAVAYHAAGRVDEAVVLHEQALAGRERVLGPEHPDTLAARNNLANAKRAAGRPRSMSGSASAVGVLPITVGVHHDRAEGPCG
jgi:tetratricopeptide (TPR) repeat protein